MNAQPLLRIRHLTKRYGDLVAVDDLTLDIFPGEIFALLGPNGAGKTTLIGCVSGLTSGFDGTIDAAGHDVVDDYRITRRLVGLVPQEVNYDGVFSVRESLAFQGGYFGVRPDEGRIRRLLQQFSLEEKIDATSRWLSGGMKRRLMICKALMHEPVLLFLDEPTAGVDVELRDELWRYVRELRDAGTTIVLTTHYLEEAEELADRIGIIDRGRLVRVDEREALMTSYGRRTLVVTLDGPAPVSLLDAVADLEPASEGNVLRLELGDEGAGASIDRLLREIYGAGRSVVDLETRRSSLEEIFRELVYPQEES